MSKHTPELLELCNKTADRLKTMLEAAYRISNTEEQQVNIYSFLCEWLGVFTTEDNIIGDLFFECCQSERRMRYEHI